MKIHEGKCTEKILKERERIGSRLAILRKKRNMTQEELANLCGVNRVNIAKIEKGAYNVSIDILSKVTSALGFVIDIIDIKVDSSVCPTHFSQRKPVKLLITGKGRCNITSSLDMEGFIKNTPGNGMFLYSSYQQFTNKDILAFLKKQGLEVKEERGNRIFPITDKSMDVLECFKKRLKELNVKIYLNESAKQILIKKTETEERVIGVKTDKKN